MPDHAKEYSFDVIEFTMRANESCFDQFEFGKTLMKSSNFILKLNNYSCAHDPISLHDLGQVHVF